MDLFATRGLIQTLRSAPDNTVVSVRVVRDAERANATSLRPLVETPAPNATTRTDVVARFSSRALRLAGSRADAPERALSTHREPPPRGQRLDVLA